MLTQLKHLHHHAKVTFHSRLKLWEREDRKYFDWLHQWPCKPHPLNMKCSQELKPCPNLWQPEPSREKKLQEVKGQMKTSLEQAVYRGEEEKQTNQRGSIVHPHILLLWWSETPGERNLVSVVHLDYFFPRPADWRQHLWDWLPSGGHLESISVVRSRWPPLYNKTCLLFTEPCCCQYSSAQDTLGVSPSEVCTGLLDSYLWHRIYFVVARIVPCFFSHINPSLLRCRYRHTNISNNGPT